MMSNQGLRKSDSLCKKKAALVMLAATLVLPAIQRTEAATNVVVWDTGSRLANAADVESRAGWIPVPVELFASETDPPKAASDPGYYGREYSFKGDAIVENRSLVAVFWSAKGRVVIYSKDDATLSGAADASAVFVFDKTKIVEIKPAGNMKGFSLEGQIEYGVAPSFIGDDLIYGAADYASANSLGIPAEHVFVGLLAGENTELVMTWPNGKQPVRLELGSGPQGNRLIESADFENSGQSIYLAPLSAPGIWHRETLAPSYLEKDVKIDWKRPFPARWTTQLYEADVKTTFAFREAKGEIWRGVPGSYDYPVWLAGDDAFYHLSKKVPPKGESLIYFLEGQNTPASFPTP